MGAVRGLATVLFVLCIPIGLITTNVRFVSNEPRVYRYAIDNYGGVLATGIDRDQLLRAGGQIRDYFNNGEDTLNIRVSQAGRDVSLFNPQETQHMKDVKSRFRLMNRVQEFSIIYILAYVAVVVLWAGEVTNRQLAMLVLAGCGIGMAVLGGAAIVGLSGFNGAWENFHKLIFTNDFWRLNPATDHLIQMFPPDFWQSIVYFIGVLTAAETALIMIGCGIYLGVTKHSESTSQLEPFYA